MTDKEIKVYLSLLPLGNINLQELAKRIDLPRTTIYNTLNLMLELGLIKEHKLFKNQVNYDPDVSQHQHFCCVNCHAIIDVENKIDSRMLKKFEQETGVRINEASMLLKGLCQTCANTNH